MFCLCVERAQIPFVPDLLQHVLEYHINLGTCIQVCASWRRDGMCLDMRANAAACTCVWGGGEGLCVGGSVRGDSATRSRSSRPSVLSFRMLTGDSAALHRGFFPRPVPMRLASAVVRPSSAQRVLCHPTDTRTPPLSQAPPAPKRLRLAQGSCSQLGTTAGGGGGGHIPHSLKRVGQIFFRAFGQSKCSWAPPSLDQ